LPYLQDRHLRIVQGAAGHKGEAAWPPRNWAPILAYGTVHERRTATTQKDRRQRANDDKRCAAAIVERGDQSEKERRMKAALWQQAGRQFSVHQHSSPGPMRCLLISGRGELVPSSGLRSVTGSRRRAGWRADLKLSPVDLRGSLGHSLRHEAPQACGRRGKARKFSRWNTSLLSSMAAEWRGLVH
jgi:hypothetical protein